MVAVCTAAGLKLREAESRARRGADAHVIKWWTAKENGVAVGTPRPMSGGPAAAWAWAAWTAAACPVSRVSTSSLRCLNDDVAMMLMNDGKWINIVPVYLEKPSYHFV